MIDTKSQPEKSKAPSFGNAAFACIWLLTGIMLATSRPSMPFSLLEPQSADYWVALAIFTISSVPLISKSRTVISFPWLHLSFLVFVFLIRPRSFLLGRDACTFILIAYIVAFVLFSRLFKRYNRQCLLFIVSSLACFLLLNSALTMLSKKSQRALRKSGLIDYGDVIGNDNPGGFLQANLNTEWIGEFPHSRIITDEFGFRVAGKTTRKKPPGTLRIIIIGDSFVTGIRTDQSQTIGKRLENTLSKRLDRKVEVLISGADNPYKAARLIRRSTLGFQPDCILVGLTLGNDFISAYLDRRNISIESEQITPRYLPEDAYNVSLPGTSLIKLDRSLQTWELYKVIRTMISPYGIYSWNKDYPGRVSVFDVSSGLGYYYSANKIPIIQESIQDVKFYISRMQEICANAGVRFVIVLLPQRFQVRQDEWDAAMFDYGLNENAFDRDLPNRQILDFCSTSHLVCIDPTSELRNQTGNLYFPRGDMHLNARGQAVVAEYLADHLSVLSSLPGVSPAQTLLSIDRHVSQTRR